MIKSYPLLKPLTDQLMKEVNIAIFCVYKTKVAYDTAVKDLQKLLDKPDAQQKDMLWKAILKSKKTYDEILSYIEPGNGVVDE